MASSAKTAMVRPVPTSISSLAEKSCAIPPERMVRGAASGSQFALNEPLSTRPSTSVTMMAAAPPISIASSSPGRTTRLIFRCPNPAYTRRMIPMITAPPGKPPPGE